MQHPSLTSQIPHEHITLLSFKIQAGKYSKLKTVIKIIAESRCNEVIQTKMYSEKRKNFSQWLARFTVSNIVLAINGTVVQVARGTL